MFILQFAILIYSVILHEIAHGWVADRLGDPTARLAKRLTLDPRPHIDPFMTIGLPLLLLVSGSPVIFGAAKPVPIDPYNFREPQKDTALTSAAGPLTNLLLAVIFALILRFVPEIAGLAFYGVQINVILAVFNLLPFPPLDGFKLIGGLLPDKYAVAWNSLERFGLWFLFPILFLFPAIFSNLVYPMTQTILRLLLP